MMSLERARAAKVTWVSLVGLVLVPLLVAAGFLWATWDSETRLGRVQAAIVNDDVGTTIDEQFVPLGRQLAGALVNGDEVADTFDWVLTDTDDARAGLESGTYAAAVTIPESFSRQATSFSADDVAAIAPATIEVQTSQVGGITDGVVAQVITTAARDTLNTELTEQYLDNVYLGFSSTKEQFESVASGARKIADGSGDLSDGLDQTSTGTTELADGLKQLDDGAQQLATGMTELADGTQRLPKQTRQLADGAAKSADGADDLADGVKQYVDGVKQLDKQLPQFTKGLGRTAEGAEELATGTGQLSAGMKNYAAGISQFAVGLDTYATTMSNLTPEALQATVQCPAQIEEVGACEAFYAGAVAGTKVAGAGLTADNGENPSLVDSASSLASNASTISINLGKISTGVTGLSTGLSRLDTGAGTIKDGVDTLATNGTELARGTKSLATGLGKLADGTDALSTGLTQLNKGIQQTATGTSELAIATDQSATGARRLSDGLVALADGGGQLAAGSGELATGLEEGAEQIPTYDEQQRTALSSVVATPVTAERPVSLFADVTNVTFLAVLALWLGGLASFVVLRAIPSRVLTSMQRSWRLAGEALLPAVGIAAVQAIALTTVLQILLALSAGQVVALLPFTLLASLAFVAVNHALVAWFGGVGRFVSIAAVVLASAAAITEAVPPLLSQLVPFLPLTPALEGARAIATGTSVAAGSAGLLLAWSVASLAAGVLAVARHRMAKVPAPVPARP